jgi:hypothetical protein
MADSNVSIWFDFHVATAATDNAPFNTTTVGKTGLHSVSTPVGSLIMKNVYLGDFDKGAGLTAPMGFWDWIPKCVSLSKEVCAFPLPDKWKQPYRGGWHWGERDKRFHKPFLALTRDKPLGEKIGVIDNFKVEDFRGYKAGEYKARNYTSLGLWIINDGQLNLSGNWQFVNLIYL